MQVIQATPADIPQLQKLFDSAVRWQKSRGVPTFAPFSDEFLSGEIDRRRIHLACEAEELVGTISIYESDALIWDGDAEPALYIHRLASAKTTLARGVGAALINWARSRAREMGKTFLRVDCWAQNQDLIEFYQRQGFSVVREKDTGSDPSLPRHYQNIRLTLFEMTSD